MAEHIINTVEVELTNEDANHIRSMVEDSPFPKNVLLKLALRIGIQEIKRDPAILMKYVAKKS
jgi:hypothetical protein